MKQQIDHEKSGKDFGASCIAWFKLADLITRREKEKALNLYRLLSHSFEDKAYALQLEADMLWSLEDNLSLKKYVQAAFLYEKENRFICAFAVYQHLLTLKPQNFDYLSKLLNLCFLLSWEEKFEKNYNILLEHLDNGFITQDQVFVVSSKLINYLCDVDFHKRAVSDQEELKYSLSKEERKKFKWVLKSLAFILKKKNNKLYERIKDYCLEKNLNFNS